MRFGGHKVIFSLFVLSVNFGAEAPAHAAKIQQFQGDVCREQARLKERSLRIPDFLLAAISLTETGRWMPARKAMFAWPWTVTAQGKGRFFDTKAEAIKAVEALQRKGVKSIDVGCMQINLFYHPRAFKDLNDAFNPVRNIDYASRFLKGLYDQTKSWRTAAAHYHSTNPAVNQRYQKKVLDNWANVGGNAGAIKLDRKININPIEVDAKRRAQKDLFNARLRARLDAERNLREPERRQSYLDAWRAGRGQPSFLAQLGARQRAERERRQQIELHKKSVDFAAKRRSQLTNWRITQAKRARERAAAIKAEKARRR